MRVSGDVGAALVRRLHLVALWVFVAGALSVGARAQLPPAAKSLPTLTHVDQIRRLSPEEAASAIRCSFAE